MIKAILFDLYGTLLKLPRDSRPFLKIARNQKGYGLRQAIQIGLTTHNPTLSDFAIRIGVNSQEDLPFLESKLAEDIDRVRPFADALPLINRLKQSGIKMAVISNLATPYKKPCATFGLAGYMDALIFSCDCDIQKPNPEIYKRALSLLGVTEDQTIMVGDSIKADVDGPNNIGIKGIHLRRSHVSSNSENVISSLDNILDMVINL